MKMLEKIKQQEWFKYIFAKFERKDFMCLILYALMLLGLHTFSKIIGYSKLTEQQSILYQEKLVSFFAVLLVVTGIHYIVRIITYMWKIRQVNAKD